MAADMVRAQAALASQKSPPVEGDGASRLQKEAQKKVLFQEGAYEQVAATFSGRNRLPDEWLAQLRLMYPQASDKMLRGLMKQKDDAGTQEAADICWVADLSSRHPQMLSRKLLLATRLPRDENGDNNKKTYQALAVCERPYDSLVTFVPRLGRAIAAAAYECSPGGNVSGQDQEGIEPETAVIVRCLPLVRMTKEMDKRTWKEIVDATPEVAKPTIFTLALFQQRDDSVNAAVTSSTTSCRGGVVQVVCVEFHPPDVQTAPDKKGKPIKYVLPAKVEFFTERIDALANRFWIDPMHFGSIGISRCCTPHLRSAC